MAEEAQLPIDVDQLEAHLLSGGDPERVVTAMVATNRRTPRDFLEITAADLMLGLPGSDA